MSFVFLKFQTLFFGFLGCGSLWYSRHWQGRQPGRISGGAEEPALSSPQWSAGQQHQLAWFPPSHLCLCYACPHLHFFVFSCAVVSSLLGKHHHCPVAEPAGMRLWCSRPPCSWWKSATLLCVAQQAGEEGRQRAGHARAGAPQPLGRSSWPFLPCKCAHIVCCPPTWPISPVPHA